MRFRSIGLFLAVALASQAAAQPRGRDRNWIASIVSRISAADRGAGEAEGAGVATLRVRINADGTLDAVALDAGTGVPALDARVLQAARAAAPFPPPPQRLVTLEGFTELSFPFRVEPRARKR